MPLTFTDKYTVARALSPTETALATLSTGTPYAYWLKAANAGTIAQRMRIEQQSHVAVIRDNSVVPASAQPRGAVGTPSDTVAYGGNPNVDQLLVFDTPATIVATAAPDGALAGGSIHVTMGIAEP